ncbi:adenylyltransferase/cytidyltransferase family protein [Haloferula chungangensis]|uniref:Adenylyltransferase/cytidyltransferase family protein n=1 Tax=Haloferula chungangensis TaxID=1048331 RepID=A0ABW2L8I3_9BACT
MSDSSQKTVMVSGCFDLLHAGHIAFFEEASSFGKLIVSVGSDANIAMLKGRPPLFSEDERVYLVGHVDCVHEARVGSGVGMLDFEPDLIALKPDVFVVNEDGYTPAKEELCKRLGIEFKVLERKPAADFKPRSSSDSKARSELPYRLCIAGGWMDQPWVSEMAGGSVVVARLQPNIKYMDRAGMATSTRQTAAKLWGKVMPTSNFEEEGRVLFACENPPGTEYISGSQDALGMVLPGINRLVYAGDYWPERIESCTDPEVAQWLQRVLHLVPVAERPDGYDPLVEKHLDAEFAARLGKAGDLAWESILAKDAAGLGKALNETLESWKQLLPHTVSDELMETRAQLSEVALGSCYSGCGGGYLMMVSEEPVENAIDLRISLPAVDF